MSFRWLRYFNSSNYQFIIYISYHSRVVFEYWMRLQFFRFLSINPIFKILGLFYLFMKWLVFLLFFGLFSHILLLNFDFLFIFLDLIISWYFLLLLIIILDIVCKLTIEIILAITSIVRMSMSMLP